METGNRRVSTLAVAFKNCIPVIFGYLPTGFAFGLMLVSGGYHFLFALLMSMVIYAGAGQYLAVQLLASHVGLFQSAVMTFLINSKHLFYGLSLLEEYNTMGWMKPYLIFSLTDETYALLTGPRPKNVDQRKYCFFVSLINQCAWIGASVLGAAFGSFVHFNTKGMDFAMTALFLVIVMDQLKSYKSKIPFVTGILSAMAAYLIVGKDNMLLAGAVFSVIILILLRKRVISRQES